MTMIRRAPIVPLDLSKAPHDCTAPKVDPVPPAVDLEVHGGEGWSLGSAGLRSTQTLVPAESSAEEKRQVSEARQRNRLGGHNVL